MGGACSNWDRQISISEKPREHCGVVGVALTKPLAPETINNTLVSLQHRGYDSAGISTLGRNGLELEIAEGEVINLSQKLKPPEGDIHDLFTKRMGAMVGWEDALALESPLVRMRSGVGIGHVRYATCGDAGVRDAQPYIMKSNGMRIALAYNGNVANVQDARAELKKRFGYECTTTGDTEVLAALIALNLRRDNNDIDNMAYALAEMAKVIDGSYSITILTSHGDVIAFRDRLGIRPLCMGWNDDGEVMFASETVALDGAGFKHKVRDILPGEMVFASVTHVRRGAEEFDDSTSTIAVESRQILDPAPRLAHCMFEWVYFANAASVIEGRGAEQVRYALGKELAAVYAKDFEDVDIIVPVPDSSRPAANGISNYTGLPVREGFIKNRHYTKRAFLLNNQKDRAEAVRRKLTVVPWLVKNKRVLLVEDSIVRGTTLDVVVSMLRDAGAKSVKVAVTCPPVAFSCHYGVDMSNPKELAATDTSIEQLELDLGVDGLYYQRLGGLLRAIDKGDDVCTACLTGKYPTRKGGELARLARNIKGNGRLTEAKEAIVQ